MIAENNVSVLQPMALEPKTEFLFLPFGHNEIQDNPAGWDFNRSGAETLLASFNAIGRPLVIDYEHQTMGFSMPQFRSPDGKAPAAGWIASFEIRDDGLWATNVRWTPAALSMLQSGEYLYFSPVIFWQDKKWGTPASLGPAALTNDPNINNLPAVAARRGTQRGEADAWSALRGSKHDCVSASKAFTEAPEATQQLHWRAVAYANANGCDYATALRAIA